MNTRQRKRTITISEPIVKLTPTTTPTPKKTPTPKAPTPKASTLKTSTPKASTPNKKKQRSNETNTLITTLKNERDVLRQELAQERAARKEAQRLEAAQTLSSLSSIAASIIKSSDSDATKAFIDATKGPTIK